MANDGDKQDPNGAPPPPSVDEAQAALEAAQAAAEAAAAAAAEAARKAAELAAAAAEAKAPPQVSESPDLGVKQPKASPPPPPQASSEVPARVAPSPAPNALEIRPNSEGLFGTDIIDEEAGARVVPERPYLRDSRNVPAIIALFVALGLIIGGIVYLVVDEESNTRMKWFLEGTSCAMDQKTMEPVIPVPPEPPGNLNCLKLYVEKERRAAEAFWKAEDFRSRHIYGDATLTYFPEDARVNVYQTKYVQLGTAWTRNEAGPGEMVCDGLYTETADEGILTDALKGKKRCERELANPTTDLKEREYIKEIPLRTLPIFETDKCTDDDPTWNAESQNCKGADGFYDIGSVVNAYTFEYRIKISREGYEPREFVWRRGDWRRGSPNYSMDWPGVDLIPKPETRMKNYVMAECEVYCYQILKDVAYADIPPDTLDRILNRNGFKDNDDFATSRGVLTRGEFTEWWTSKSEAIQKFTKKECGDEERDWCDEVSAVPSDPAEAPPQ